MYPPKDRRVADRRKPAETSSVLEVQERANQLETEIELVRDQREEFRQLSLDLLSHLEWLYQYADPATHAELRRKMQALEAAIAARDEDTDSRSQSLPATQ